MHKTVTKMSAGTSYPSFDTGDQGYNPDRDTGLTDTGGIAGIAQRAWSSAFYDDDLDDATVIPDIESPSAPIESPIFRRWSPLIVPVAVTAIANALVWMLVNGRIVEPSSALSEGGLITMGATSLVGGVLLGVLLYGASSDAAWLGILVAGSVVLPTGILMAGVGIVAAVLLIAGAAAGCLYYTKTHLCRRPVGTVTLTSRKGRYCRTLYPGLNLLRPGEHVLGRIETGLRVHTTPAQHVTVQAPDGRNWHVSASAVVNYAIIPQEAHTAVPYLHTWEQDVQELVASSLRDALSAWCTQSIIAGGATSSGALAISIRDEVRDMARTTFGVWIKRVRVANIQFPTAAALRVSAPRSAPRPDIAVGDESWADESTEIGSLYPDLSLWARPGGGPASRPTNGEQATALRVNRVVGETTSARVPADSLLTPESLADTYESVRSGQVTDPTIIREIAHAFVRYSVLHGNSNDLHFDAPAAADLLLQFAARTERYMREGRRAAANSQPRGAGAHDTPTTETLAYGSSMR